MQEMEEGILKKKRKKGECSRPLGLGGKLIAGSLLMLSILMVMIKFLFDFRLVTTMVILLTSI